MNLPLLEDVERLAYAQTEKLEYEFRNDVQDIAA